MKVSAQEVIMKCMDLGLMVTINQRLDMDTFCHANLKDVMDND